MSCNSVRLFFAAFLSALFFGTVASAQDVINYHVWDPAKVGAALPADSASDHYFPYLLQDPNTPLQPEGVIDRLLYTEDNLNLPYREYFIGRQYNAIASSDKEHFSMVDSGAGPLPVRHGRPYRATLGWNLDKTEKNIAYNVNLVLHNDDFSTENNYAGYFSRYASIYIYTLPFGNNLPHVTIKSDTPGTARVLRGTDTPQFTVKWDSNLTVSSDVQFIGNTNNGSNYFSNVIELNGGELNANNVVFQQNINRSSYYQNDTRSSEVSYLGGGAINAARYRRYMGNVEYGFDLYEDEQQLFSCDYYNSITGFYDNYQDYRSDIDINGAKFDRNEASVGGAILLANSDLTGSRVVFTGNKAVGDTNPPFQYGVLLSNYGGGAVFAKTQSNVRLEDSNFTFNSASFDYRPYGGNGLAINADYTAHGGAIYSENSNLHLKGSNFRSNTATGFGGAVFFDVNDGRKYVLELGAFEGASSGFEGNLQEYDVNTRTGVANSVAFGNTAGQTVGNILVNVNVEGNKTNFNMFDPMQIAGVKTVGANGNILVADTNLVLNFEKTGQGSWNLYGNSNLTRTKGSTGIHVAEGTFLLGNGAVLNMSNTKALDSVLVDKNAVLAIGDAGAAGTGVTLVSTETKLTAGSTLQLNNDFVFETAGKSSEFNGTITGSGDFIKSGTGTATFGGKTEQYSGDLILRQGEFVMSSSESFKTGGSVIFEDGTTLAVTANSNVPNINALGISIGEDVNIRIAGVAASEQHFVVLESATAIMGNFADNPALPVNVDYLTAAFDFNKDRTKYEGTVALTWNKSNPTDENGTFTVETGTAASDYFRVDVVLEDNTQEGKKLTKSGRGTLELAKANLYRGGTDVKQGTLLLTNAQATGTGPVNIGKNAYLTLNFNGSYHNEISGAGQVIKAGNHTVKLTNALNDYSGGTVIKEGAVSIENDDVLGTGSITFDGGKLHTKNADQEIVINQYVVSKDNSDAWFDTETDTAIGATSSMSGNGGLRKTGAGKLTLQGIAGYKGTTKLEEGTLSLAALNSIGKGDVELSDGTVFENTAVITNNRNLILVPAIQPSTAQGSILNTVKDWKQTGTINGTGGLTKTGEGTLTLTNSNSFSGGLMLREGTVAFDSLQNLGTGSLVFDGGTLKNTSQISDLPLPISMTDGNSIRLETAKDLVISSRLTGSGGLVKTGKETLLLTGISDYRGDTVVNEGKLFISGSLTHTDIVVNDGAALGGNGTVYGSVDFNPGSSYIWYVGLREEDSPYLTVKGNVRLDKTVFTPITSSNAEANYPDIIDGWTVLKYGNLDGDKRFVSVNNEWSPFYDFELDYSSHGEINVVGYHRRDPRPLSDSVAMSIVMPQQQVHRRAFEQIDKELSGGRYLGLKPLRLPNQQTRGQVQAPVDHLWGSMYGRSTEYESSFHTLHPWRFNSFGVQLGYSFLSANWLSMGVTAGFEMPLLKNAYDKIEMCDSYAGFYFGKRIYGMWELKGYLGAGYQDYKSTRNDTRYIYKAKYRGDSFETSIEIGRPVMLGSTVLRSHFGFDLQYAGTQGSVEKAVSSEYRTYSNASLTRLYATVGLDAQRQYQRGDMFAGVAYSNMVGGQTLPSVDVYYPVSKSGTRLYGTTLGQNIFTIRGGGNYYFDARRSQSLFLNITGDIFADRAGGQGEVAVTVGYDYRF